MSGKRKRHVRSVSIEELDELRAQIGALDSAAIALDDWIAIHAGAENCGVERVRVAQKRIAEGFGTIAYATAFREKIRDVAAMIFVITQDPDSG